MIERICAGLLIAALVAPWAVNVYKLAQCDFDTPLRCEVIHGIGLLGLASYVTVWFGTDN